MGWGSQKTIKKETEKYGEKEIETEQVKFLLEKENLLDYQIIDSFSEVEKVFFTFSE